MVLFFYGVGQLVMVAVRRRRRPHPAGRLDGQLHRPGRRPRARPARSTTGTPRPGRRCGRWPSSSPRSPWWSGWLAVEIFVFSRLRIGVYDTEYVSPPADEDQQ